MRSYRLYRLDERGHITARVEFEALNDEGAISHARTDHFDADCEIWEIGRMVALVPRDGPVRLIDAID